MQAPENRPCARCQNGLGEDNTSPDLSPLIEQHHPISSPCVHLYGFPCWGWGRAPVYAHICNPPACAGAVFDRHPGGGMVAHFCTQRCTMTCSDDGKAAATPVPIHPTLPPVQPEGEQLVFAYSYLSDLLLTPPWGSNGSSAGVTVGGLAFWAASGSLLRSHPI